MQPFPVDPEKDTICDVTRRWADVQPDAPAILSKSSAPITYGTLVARMDQIRRSLNDCGFGRGDRIAILHSGGVDMAFLMMGIMGGATTVPINPKLTEKELAISFSQKGVQALVVEASIETPARSVARQQGIPIIEAAPAGSGDEQGPILSGGAEDRRFDSSPATADDYYVIHVTSGTTERGKVVPVRHRHRVVRTTRSGPDDCGLIAGPLYYGSRLSSLVSYLLSGARVVLAGSFDANDFWHFLTAFGLTQFSGNPTVLKSVLRQAGDHASDIAKSRLRFIGASGGKVEREIADEIEAIFGIPVLESYSVTETGRIVSNPLPPGRAKRGTVGLPADCEIRIRSLDGAFLGAGEYGEVVVRGPQVFEGYENDDQANADAFADGWFRTGDEGFLDEDGYLTLTGRFKEMINRGGEKVFPAEVDAALMSHAGVHEAATFPIPHPTLGEEVAAAVVQEPGSAVTDQELTRFLMERLVGFKVPRRFVFVDTIPKSDAGKVQRYTLAEVLGVGGDDAPIHGPDPGRDPSPLEARLQEIWMRVFKLDHVGLNDNFFLLGGDSLQAVGLFLEIEKAFGRRLPAACVFEAGTVAEMAALIEGGEARGCMVPIQPEGTQPPFFCVHNSAGGVVGFHELAKCLGTEQPFYGIQSVGWDRNVVPFLDSTEMAAHYVAEMRKIQPHGPYYLGGYFFGGGIAVYMADMLREAGEEVALLAIIESTSLAGRRWVTFGQWLERIGWPPGPARIVRWLERIGAPRGLGLSWLALRYAGIRTHFAWRGFRDRALCFVLVPVHQFYRARGISLPPLLARPDRCNRMMMRRGHRHMPSYAGDAVYFRAATSTGSMRHADAVSTWSRIITGRFDTVPLEGTHQEVMREPHVKLLGEKLVSELARARKKVTNVYPRSMSAFSQKRT
ncbi:MAG: AMP-binding protein [Alphaproteobacteria bacterium]|nr:AMP-binding protein [Alphaproteobacteria bacterium]